MSHKLDFKNVGWVVPAGLLLTAASIIAVVICGKVSDMSIALPFAVAVLAGGVLLVYANKDLKDRIIPHKWWLALVPLFLFNYLWGIFALGMTVFAALFAVIPAVIVLVLGLFKKVNGADCFGIVSVLLLLSPFTVCGTFAPVSWVVLVLSCIIGLILWKIKPEWRKGIPYLVPLAIAYAVFGVFI